MEIKQISSLEDADTLKQEIRLPPFRNIHEEKKESVLIPNQLVSDLNSSDCSKLPAWILVSHILHTRDDKFFNKNFPDQF